MPKIYFVALLFALAALGVAGCGNDDNTPVVGSNNPTPPLITNLVLTPPSPDTLQPGVRVNIAFDYTGMPAGGGNIWVSPDTGMFWSGSPVYPAGNGSGTAFVFRDSASSPGRLDSLTFSVVDTSGPTNLSDTTVVVDYVWQ